MAKKIPTVPFLCPHSLHVPPCSIDTRKFAYEKPQFTKRRGLGIVSARLGYVRSTKRQPLLNAHTLSSRAHLVASSLLAP